MDQRKKELLEIFNKAEEELGIIYDKEKKNILLNELLLEFKEKVFDEVEKQFENECLNNILNYSEEIRISRDYKTNKQLIYKQMLDEQIREQEFINNSKKPKSEKFNPVLYNYVRPYTSREEFFNLRNASHIFSK